jgi:hypothetical protein
MRGLPSDMPPSSRGAGWQAASSRLQRLRFHPSEPSPLPVVSLPMAAVSVDSPRFSDPFAFSWEVRRPPRIPGPRGLLPLYRRGGALVGRSEDAVGGGLTYW